jgi:hypothetical protein
MNTMIEGLHDPQLDAAWARLVLQPELPPAATRMAIRQAARESLAARAPRVRSKWPFVIGAIFVAAAAAAAVSFHLWNKPPVGVVREVADAASPVPAMAAEVPPPAIAVPELAPVARAIVAPARSVVTHAAAATGLVVLPPGEDPFFALARAEANARFQALLNSNDERTWVAGLLFDHELHVKAVADPVVLPTPKDGAPDSGLTDDVHFAAKAFGLRTRDFDQGVGFSLSAAPTAVGAHPRILVWAYAGRDPAALENEAAVRAAVLAHYDQHLPERPAGGDVALLTVVMTADGGIDRFNEEYRQAPTGPLTDESFDADRDQRFALLGMLRGQISKSGSMMMFSDDLPGGKPGRAVIVSYAWPGTAQPDNATGNVAAKPAGGVDERAAVAMLKALFTTSQLQDSSDGQQPWVILDHGGHALHSGRAPANDPKAPIQMQLMEAFPGIRIENAAVGDYRDPAIKGRHYAASFFWLAADSPPLP